MILNGIAVADEIKQQLKNEINAAVLNGKRKPKLVIITVGEDPASKVYVRNKIKACDEIGIVVEHLIISDTVDESDLKELIYSKNTNTDIDGIMVQLPLPQNFNEREIIDAIDPEKDVDGLTTANIGKLRSGQSCIKPCTAQGIIDLLDYYNIEIDGKDAVIIGRSNIVGKPLADLMMLRGATVTQCHSRTKDLAKHIANASIVVSAVGKPNFINYNNYIGYSHTLIDVGINRDENGKLCGDINCENKENTNINITPVPGGVGPMTVTELMKNTIEVWKATMDSYCSNCGVNVTTPKAKE